MSTAQIRIDQPAHPTTPIGVSGRSRDDIVISSLVQLRNHSDVGVRSHWWEILDQPNRASPVQLSNPTAAAPTFTPNAEGTYRVRLTVNEGRTGQVDTRTVVIRNAAGGRCPAAGERAESNWIDTDTGLPNVRGWATDLCNNISLASAGGGWESVYEIDLTAEANQSVDGSDNLTVDGVTWYGRDFDGGGGRTDKHEITNLVGMELDTQDGSGDTIFELVGSPSEDDVPSFEVSLADLYDFRWTDRIRVVIDTDLDFDNDGGFAYAGLGLRTIDVTTPGKGTPTTHHAHVTRRNNASNALETVFRANANEDGSGIVLARPGVDTLASCSFMMEWAYGIYTAYVGGPYSSGWPTWNIVSSARPVIDTPAASELNIAEFNNQSNGPFDLRLLMTVYRSGGTSDNARMNVKRLQVYVRREDLP